MSNNEPLVDCKLLKRRAAGVDINPDAVARNRLDFGYALLDADYIFALSIFLDNIFNSD